MTDSTKASERLLPCPFCGGEAVSSPDGFIVECGGDCSCPISGYAFDFGAWQVRTTPQTPHSERVAFEAWLLNGNRFMTDPYSIFCAGYQAARTTPQTQGVMGEDLTELLRQWDEEVVPDYAMPNSVVDIGNMYYFAGKFREALAKNTPTYSDWKVGDKIKAGGHP